MKWVGSFIEVEKYGKVGRWKVKIKKFSEPILKINMKSMEIGI